MATIFVTEKIPDSGIALLKDAGHTVLVSAKDGALTHDELVASLHESDPEAVLCTLNDKITTDVFEAAPRAKIFANFAVGFDNVDLVAATAKNVVVSNTPGVLTDTVAEHTIAMMLAITNRIAEGDRFMRANKYKAWGPMMLLGTDLMHKTLGIVGAGRIGERVAHIAREGLHMDIIYTDVAKSPTLEESARATYYDSVDALLPHADIVSLHVPLIPATQHLINAARLSTMKPSAYLINSSRGAVVDEAALTEALKSGVIRGAALDVYENEPKVADGLTELENVVLTPHIASASIEARSAMAEVAAKNIIAVLSGAEAPNRVVVK